jgi:hypothetical protein
MLGGGTFVTQNKTLPGAYINFVSATSNSNGMSERGTGAMCFASDWLAQGVVTEITAEDFLTNSTKILGHDYGDDSMLVLREFFKNGSKLYAYNLNGGGVRANNAYCTAKNAGTRGNDLKTVIAKNVDNTNLYDVSTYLSTMLVDKQTVATAKDLVGNDFVTFQPSASLAATAGTNLTGGTNGTFNETQVAQNFINALEPYSFNGLCVVTDNSSVNSLLAAYTKRMRDSIGKKFQAVVFDTDNNYDYEGVIVVPNQSDEDDGVVVAWVLGATCSCEINKSLVNTVYNGELEIDSNYTQLELEDFIKNGLFVFHKVGAEIRVLKDINSLTTTTDEKGDVFKNNQTVRICDQIATDYANIFNTRYLGKVPNDKSGRSALANDFTKYCNDLMTIRAIEDFTSDDIVVDIGDTKTSVVATNTIKVVNTMEQLYMKVVIN